MRIREPLLDIISENIQDFQFLCGFELYQLTSGMHPRIQALLSIPLRIRGKKMREYEDKVAELFQFLCGFEQCSAPPSCRRTSLSLSIPLRIRAGCVGTSWLRMSLRAFNSFADSSARQKTLAGQSAVINFQFLCGFEGEWLTPLHAPRPFDFQFLCGFEW